jgi:hypothetical protein
MLAIDNLEMHVAHGCNLTCESCSHYSNQGHKGLVSLDEAQQWMQAWCGRLRPGVFSLLGGEPALHPDLAEMVRLARRCWPHSVLRLVSNGLLLHRHAELPAALRDCDVWLFVSVHHAAPEYQEKFAPVVELLRDWHNRLGVRVQGYDSYTEWTRRYHGSGAGMEPFRDGRPRQSWQHCRARFCRQLHEGKIWKCAALAYLPMQHRKYGLSPSWAPYLEYRPLNPDCSDAELAAFFGRQEEPFCGMCPARPERFLKPLPLRHGQLLLATT